MAPQVSSSPTRLAHRISLATSQRSRHRTRFPSRLATLSSCPGTPGPTATTAPSSTTLQRSAATVLLTHPDLSASSRSLSLASSAVPALPAPGPPTPSSVSDSHAFLGRIHAYRHVENGFSWNVKVPSSLASGSYVLRHEIIGLHSAGNPNGAQAYPQVSTISE
jgi:hypothetical protein